MHPDHSPTYYLANFQTVLKLVAARYADLLTPDEQSFIVQFAALPVDARALLVRLIMRSRDLFATDALRYDEISDLPAAIALLHAVDFADQDATLSLDEVFSVCTKPELLAGLAGEGLSARQSKSDMRLALAHLCDEHRTLSGWLSEPSRKALRLNVRSLANTCRLLFFGNLHQDWSEFVITDLGHLRYETVSIPDAARGFLHRADLDTCLELHALRASLEAGESAEALFQRLPVVSASLSSVVASRVNKLTFQLGQAAERSKDWSLARTIYQHCSYKGARHRLMRVHEQLADWPAAFAVAQDILREPASEAELQATRRAMPRLARKLRLPVPAQPEVLLAPLTHLELAEAPPVCVEVSVAQVLTQGHQQAHYVENTLFSSLFGLVFWEAVFAPVPGAFFNPFQAGPADLFHPEFASRRASQIQAGFDALASDNLADDLISRWQCKFGLQNHFVFWAQLSEDLLQQALRCMPRESLQVIFKRMLDDLKNHRSGFPDLIVFDTVQQTFELVEVKAPGDRVQDNQARWMDYFLRHGIPCRVIHASWPNP